MKYSIYLRSDVAPTNPEWFKPGSAWKMRNQIVLGKPDTLSNVENQPSLGVSFESIYVPSGSVVVLLKTIFTETSVAQSNLVDYYGIELRLLTEDGKVGDRHIYVESIEDSLQLPLGKERQSCVWEKAWINWLSFAESAEK